jgi:hypothetical protein
LKAPARAYKKKKTIPRLFTISRTNRGSKPSFHCRIPLKGVVVKVNGRDWDPRELDRWLKANAILGSLLAIGMLAMALAGYNLAAELSSVTALQ